MVYSFVVQNTTRGTRPNSSGVCIILNTKMDANVTWTICQGVSNGLSKWTYCPIFFSNTMWKKSSNFAPGAHQQGVHIPCLHQHLSTSQKVHLNSLPWYIFPYHLSRQYARRDTDELILCRFPFSNHIIQLTLWTTIMYHMAGKSERFLGTSLPINTCASKHTQHRLGPMSTRKSKEMVNCMYALSIINYALAPKKAHQ